jgi:hypothetical protein
MTEVFPILSGVVVGVLVGGARPQTRVHTAALLCVVLGFTATVISGEFRIGWEYLLVDIPLVAVSAVVSFLLARTMATRARHPV